MVEASVFDWEETPIQELLTKELFSEMGIYPQMATKIVNSLRGGSYIAEVECIKTMGELYRACPYRLLRAPEFGIKALHILDRIFNERLGVEWLPPRLRR